MEVSKPTQVEVKVTWRFAWSLWWRQLLFSVALGAIIYVPFIVLMLWIGISVEG